MIIRQAIPADLVPLADLFAQYRKFYGQPYDTEVAAVFLEERMRDAESVLFVAEYNGHFAGFTQLYPSFSSVGLQRIWILNDLFVAEACRQNGVARALIDHVFQYSRETGRSKVSLATAYDNVQAQRLYGKLGFVREDFYNYEKVV